MSQYARQDSLWQMTTWESPKLPLPRPKQFPITQFTYARLDGDIEHGARLPDGGLQWTRFLPEEVGAFGGLHDPMTVVPLALKDCLLSASLLMPELPRVIAPFVLTHKMTMPLRTGPPIENLLQQLAVDADLTMSPVPGDLAIWASEVHAIDGRPPMPISELRHGEWSVIVCHEAPYLSADPSACVQLRYAFAALRPDASTCVLSVEQFLRETMFPYKTPSLDSILTKWNIDVDRLLEKIQQQLMERALLWSRLRHGQEHSPEVQDSAVPHRIKGGVCEADEVEQVFEVVMAQNRR